MVSCDTMSSMDNGRVTILGLLDLSAAFDTVDHSHLSTHSLCILECNYSSIPLLTGSVPSSLVFGCTSSTGNNNWQPFSGISCLCGWYLNLHFTQHFVLSFTCAAGYCSLPLRRSSIASRPKSFKNLVYAVGYSRLPKKFEWIKSLKLVTHLQNTLILLITWVLSLTLPCPSQTIFGFLGYTGIWILSCTELGILLLYLLGYLWRMH